MLFQSKFRILILLKLLQCSWIVLSLANEDDDDEPYQVQRAQCTITAGEVQASAEATMTKTLKGVCGSEEMQLAFKELEIKLMKDIQDIKVILNNLLHSNNLMILKKDTASGGATTNKINSIPEIIQNIKSTESVLSKTQNSNNIKNIENDLTINNLKIETTTTEKIINNGKMNATKLKSLEMKNSHRNKINREPEIHKLNNTVLSGEEIKLFSYYWKLENFSKKLEYKNSSAWSPLFSIAGKQLRIKAIFNHLQRDFLYLLLERVTSDLNRKFKNIMLETGTIFKDIEEDMKSFKHKISILNQMNPKADLVSQEFTSIGINGFLIPNSALLSSPYSKNDTIIIKLIIYL